MARPRTPSRILDLRGAYRRNPARRRTDAEGNAPFNLQPPAHLAPECLPAWQAITSRMPLIAAYSADELAVEVAARLLTDWRASGDLRMARELRSWLIELGFTPRSRTHLAAAPPAAKPNRFAAMGNPFDEF